MKKLLLSLVISLFFFCPELIDAQWQKFAGTSGNSVMDVAALNNNLFISLNPGGVNTTGDNGTTWTAVNNGLSISNTFSLGVIGTNLVVGTGGGIYTSTNNGGKWNSTTSGISNVPNFLTVNNKIFAAAYDVGVLVSTDNGLTWASSNTGVSNISIASLCYTGSGMYAGGFSGNIFKSTDNGATWTTLNTGMKSFKVSKLAYMPSGVFASQYSEGVFISTNNGTSWAAVNNGLTDLYVNAIAVYGTNIFAGTNNSGVFISANNGTKWSSISNSLTDQSVNNLVVISNDLYACTSNGLWKRSITEIISAVDEKTPNPISFSLQQNYPNPFNPATVIRYNIPELSRVQIKVYDMLGQEIETLVNDEKAPGNYEVAFNGERLASGMYFYKLTAGNYSQTKKMMLIK